jgi:hypothetical protein
MPTAEHWQACEEALRYLFRDEPAQLERQLAHLRWTRVLHRPPPRLSFLAFCRKLFRFPGAPPG